MYSVTRERIIAAPPEEVFDHIARVTDFSRYSAYIKEVKELPRGGASGPRYRWRVRVAGISFEWEAVVTESVRPRRFAWRSVKGVYNTGAYDLDPVDEGTRVRFHVEYCIGPKLVEAAIAPLMSTLLAHLAEELLVNIKSELEART